MYKERVSWPTREVMEATPVLFIDPLLAVSVPYYIDLEPYIWDGKQKDVISFP